MLTAKYIDTGEEIDITKFDNPRLNIDKNRLHCKLCNGKVSLKHGMLRAKHFFHINSCNSNFERHPESPQHNLGKEIIAQHLKEYWSEYADAEIKFEFVVPEINRIIDIAMVFPSGWVVAHELQLAGITTEHLEKRTNDYRELGIDTFWWFGKSADTQANRQWAIERYGHSLSVEYELLDAQIKNIQKGQKI
ncbi:competence protein CoiA [Chryseobacterium indologenes]|uniref:competence protein CoiA n=1 Tax=Chryseobacterium indologenes TaxID=253 RepID=UPI003019F940